MQQRELGFLFSVTSTGLSRSLCHNSQITWYKAAKEVKGVEDGVMCAASIICLNGMSSSGKSTIAKALRCRLETPFLLVELDAFLRILPQSIWDVQALVWNHFPHFQSTFHHALAAMASNPNNMIIDHVLGPHGLRDTVEVFMGFDVVFVGVHCPVEALEAREHDRGDRHIGLAKSQLPLVHTDALYDVEVDTENLGPEECAARIVAFLQGDEPPTAIRRFREAIRERG